MLLRASPPPPGWSPDPTGRARTRRNARIRARLVPGGPESLRSGYGSHHALVRPAGSARSDHLVPTDLTPGEAGGDSEAGGGSVQLSSRARRALFGGPRAGGAWRRWRACARPYKRPHGPGRPVHRVGFTGAPSARPDPDRRPLTLTVVPHDRTAYPGEIGARTAPRRGHPPRRRPSHGDHRKATGPACAPPPAPPAPAWPRSPRRPPRPAHRRV